MKFPKLSRHATGVWFCKWGGKTHYFSRDEAASRKAYLAHIQNEYLPWREKREQDRIEAKASSELLVIELAELFLRHVAATSTMSTLAEYRKDLKRYLALHGRLPASGKVGRDRTRSVHPALLAAMQADLKTAGYSAATCNHQVTAVKTMFKWGSDMQYCPEINFRGVKLLKRSKRRPTYLKPDEVRAIIQRAGTVRLIPLDLGKPTGGTPGTLGDPRLVPYLSLQYLTLARRSEVLKLVSGKGYFVDHGLFVLDSHKTQKLTYEDRVLVLSDEALEWLASCERRPDRDTWVLPWQRADSFGKAASTHSEHPSLCRHLRSSAASHLRHLRVRGEYIDLLLGHKIPGAFGNYVQERYEHLREIVSQLTLRSAPQPSGTDPLDCSASDLNRSDQPL